MELELEVYWRTAQVCETLSPADHNDTFNAEDAKPLDQQQIGDVLDQIVSKVRYMLIGTASIDLWHKTWHNHYKFYISTTGRLFTLVNDTK